VVQSRSYVESNVNMGQTERILSLVGGAAMVLQSLTRKGWIGKAAMAVGGALLLRRGITGYCPIYATLDIDRVGPSGREGILAQKAITINRPRDEVYRAWRHFEQFPRSANYIPTEPTLERGNGGHATRNSQTPLDLALVWDTEITEERQNEQISWQSLPGSLVHGRGSVTFSDAPGNRGTEVRVQFAYDPPGGTPSVALAKLFGGGPEQQVGEDLRRFKQMMEAGEVSTIYGQTSGRVDEVKAERAQLYEQRRYPESIEVPQVERMREGND
jgi:uncharacterized membrane protein